MTRWTDYDCIVWPGRLSPEGYARVGPKYVHTMIYEANVGPIPEGHEPDHLCRVRACIQPKHLEAVPKRENIRRGESPSGKNARKTHCHNGHPFDDLNTRWRKDRPGTRECRRCQADRQRRVA